jgi:hypothetical protein
MRQILYAKGLQAFFVGCGTVNESLYFAETLCCKGFQDKLPRIQCLQGL